MRRFKTLFVPSFALAALCACASDFAVYEAPAAGRLSDITFVNASEDHSVSLVTFDDGVACIGRRQIGFGNEDSIPAGDSRALSVAAGREFALLATMSTIEEEEYSVELGATGSGPAPAISRRFTAIGCRAGVSFPVQSERRYEVVISERELSDPCSVAVSEIHADGVVVPVDATARDIRSSWNEHRSYCEPLAD